MEKIISYSILGVFFLFIANPVIGQAVNSGVDCTAAVNRNHTLCLAPNTNCNPTITWINDTNTQNLIIALHNSYRNIVGAGGEQRGAPGPQPNAVNFTIQPLRWNPVLANLSQAWASQCQFRTDAYRNMGLNGSASTPVYIGQNSYARLDYPSDVPADNTANVQGYIRRALSTWFNEVQTFNRATVPNYQYVAANGKYTQLVWGTSTDVGCGFVQWNYAGTIARVARLLFCDYGPGGNLVGFPVYAT